jgi:hypothetical protein
VAVRRKSIRKLRASDLAALRREVRKSTKQSGVARFNASPDDVQKSVVQLVLALVEFLRKLMERQAIRRMENGTLTDEEIEAVGLALMKLEETVLDLAKRFGIDPKDLNLDLGPLGKLT